MQEARLRIGFDCRFGGKNVGIGRYTRELAKLLPKVLPDYNFVFFVQDVHDDWCKDLHGELVAAPYKAYSFKEQFLFPRILKHSRLSLLFSPHFNVPFNCPVPFVVTIHDLILHRYPNGASFIKQAAYRKVFSSAVHRAKKIIAVSDMTQKILFEREGASFAPRTTVVTECASAEFTPRSKEQIAEVVAQHHVHRPYFLYVGNAKEHKQVPLLLEAFSRLPTDSPELVLVMSGKEARSIKLPPRAHVIEHVDDNDLAALYSGATSFVTASAEEGFCLPIAEAQACGCPVIAYCNGEVSKVFGSKALLFCTVDELVAAFKNPPEASPLPSHPRTWDDVAKETAEVLRSTLK